MNHLALVNGYLQPRCRSSTVSQCESIFLPQRHGLMSLKMLAISIASFLECRCNNGISAGTVGAENMPRMISLPVRQRTATSSKRPRAALRPLGPRRCYACRFHLMVSLHTFLVRWVCTKTTMTYKNLCFARDRPARAARKRLASSHSDFDDEAVGADDEEDAEAAVSILEADITQLEVRMRT